MFARYDSGNEPREFGVRRSSSRSKRPVRVHHRVLDDRPVLEAVVLVEARAL